MYKKDSHQDLVLRGFDREYILEKTGVDVGYHAASVKKELLGIDRVQYKIDFVKNNFTKADLDEALNEYANGLDSEGVLNKLGLSNTNIIKLKILFKGLDYLYEFNKVDKKRRRSIMEQGMIDKFGVDNPFKLDEFQDIAKATRKEKYGAEYTLERGSSLEQKARDTFNNHMKDETFRKRINDKKINTCLFNFGVEHPMYSEDVKEHIESTCVRRYGVTRFTKTKEARLAQSERARRMGKIYAKKAKETCLRKYGVTSYMKTEEGRKKASDYMMRHKDIIFAKMKETMYKRYGVHYTFSSDVLFEKVKNTILERYGAEYYVQSDEYKERVPSIMDKSRQTFMKNYGVSYYTQSDEYKEKLDDIKSKYKETCLELYGAENYTQSEDYKERMKDIVDKIKTTTMDRYGVTSYTQSEEYRSRLEEIINKMKETSMMKYGVEYYTKSEEYKLQLNEILDKIKATILFKYGTEYYSQSEEYKERLDEILLKSYNTKKENGTFSTSSLEEYIAETFDFIPQYRDDIRYPYSCDFYDKERDLFIEINGTWTHGSHWYNEELDRNVVDVCQKKAETSDYYKRALDTFTKRDVEKRETAKNNKLNYVTLWSDKGEDLDLWVAMGMPIGHDYECEYSWLPKRDIEKDVDISNMNLIETNVTTIVKDAQRSVFYEKELDMWDENAYRKKKWGTLQAYIYVNRYKYINKLPNELSDRELLRAFRIAGIHIGYTSFNPEMMIRVLDEYNVKSVYDPCSGWGERMTICGLKGVSYEGCDINEKLQNGYNKLIDKIDGFKPLLHVGDSAKQDIISDIDAIITCPPYMSTEVYTDKGSENLTKDKFSDWWNDVVVKCSNSNAKVFAVQTNQACRDIFLQGMLNNGWTLKEELVYKNNKASHFNRLKNNKKREYESMLVMVR